MPTPHSPPVLDFRNVSVHRGARPALHDVNLRIEAGEHVALLGPNGSGKSTLIQVISREIYPELNPATSCELFGETTWNVFQLRSRMGIVSNDLQATCARDITARELVLSGFFSSIGLWPANIVTEAMEQKARAVLELLEVPHLAERSLREVSSGEARRLVIGRALVHDPTALLLDEPTNSLDFRAAHELRTIVSKLAQAGRTIIMVTHTIADVLPEIGRVILLKDGRVVRDGSTESALTTQSLSQLYGMPLQVERRGAQHVIW